jgi:hypothetical protein
MTETMRGAAIAAIAAMACHKVSEGSWGFPKSWGYP